MGKSSVKCLPDNVYCFTIICDTCIVLYFEFYCQKLFLLLLYTMALYKLNGVNFLYGAIMYDTSNGAVYPFFTSRSDFTVSDISQNDADDSWLVMPGFKLVVYLDNTYTSTATTYDNTSGFRPLRFYASRNTTAIKLFFYGVELAQPT